MLSKPIVLTYGPSRVGKSSFINTISRREITKVGSISNKESTTDSVRSFDVNLTSLQRNPTVMTIFDVPGTDDSQMRMTNDEIKAKIEENVLSASETSKLSAILAFESLKSETVQLRTTFKLLEYMLGPEYKRSTLIVFTKEDNFKDAERLASVKQAAEEICRENNIPFIYIQNNHKNFKLDDAQYNEQFDLLMDKMKCLSHYDLKEVQHYRKRIVECAKELKLTLPKNKTTVQIEYETQRLKSEKVQVQKSRPKYEVVKKRRGGLAGLMRAKKTVLKMSMEHFMEEEIIYKPEIITETMDKEMELEYDDSHYLDLAKKEVSKEIRAHYCSK